MCKRIFPVVVILGLSLLFLPASVLAEEAVAASTTAVESTSVEQLQTKMNFVWVMVAAALVFIMQAGFMCVESGLSRAKNSINVAIKNMADLLIAVSAFALVGFGLMFGVSQSGLFGTSDFLADFGNDPWLPLFFVFQAVFCGTAATIDSGAVAERTRFVSYLFISAFVSAIIYPIFGHWAWGSFVHSDSPGWLESMGFIDFAGSSVVHSVGGWVALAGVICIGARHGKFDENGKPVKLQAHNLPLVYLGTFILFFGWFGFNCGSTLEATTDIAPIALTTIISACFAGLSASALSWIFSDEKLPQAEMIANGVLGGLVGITAGCAHLSPQSAILVGLMAGVLVYAGSVFLERVLKLDDVVGAIPVHGVCGAWGTVAVGLFITPEKLAETGLTWGNLILVQCLGVLACFVWAFTTAFLFIQVLKLFFKVRVSEEHERLGLNVAEHGASSSLLDLAHGMQRAVTASEYSPDLKVAVENGTEAAGLAICFNELVDTICLEQIQTRNAMTKLREQRDAISVGLERYRTTVKENIADIDEQNSMIQNVLEDTTERTTTLVTAVQGMSTRIDGLVESLRVAAKHSQDAKERAVDGREGSDASLEVVAKLDESSREIEQVIHLIRDIAEQTNLLALNATIEAARAGEAGKGFTVVATEVKELAKQSADSTTQIDNFVSTIQSDTESVSKTIDYAVSSVKAVESLNTDVCASIDLAVDEHKEAAATLHTFGENVTELVDDVVNALSKIRDSARRTTERVQSSYDDLSRLMA